MLKCVWGVYTISQVLKVMTVVLFIFHFFNISSSWQVVVVASVVFDFEIVVGLIDLFDSMIDRLIVLAMTSYTFYAFIFI